MSTFSPDWAMLRRIHNNCLNNNTPVLDWNTFSDAVADLMMEHTYYQSARRRVAAAQESAVPNTHADRYTGFLCDQPPHVVELFGLDSDTFLSGGPNHLHQSDLVFHLTHGKAKRNPLAAMKKRAAGFRKATRALEEGLRRYENRKVAFLYRSYCEAVKP